MDGLLLVVRGGGDLATGTVHRLWSAGFSVVVLETERPAAIRRQVSLCEAVYEGEVVVEGMKGVLVQKLEDVLKVLERGEVPVLVDSRGESIGRLKPDVVIDGILAKKNLGTHRGMAPLTIALGPGFCAGEDVDVVIETKRGHNLGRVIWEGRAIPNTGIPGNIGGYTAQRVLRASETGVLKTIREIGDLVKQGEVIAGIQTQGEEVLVKASIDGIIRGLIRDGFPVTTGFKIVDIDPRQEELENCFTISDKARCIGGSVLEVVCSYWKKKEGKGDRNESYQTGFLEKISVYWRRMHR